MSVMRVAKAANVSHTTVSRVINRDPAVTPKLAAQVFKAMREVGYVPPAPEARRGPKPRAKKTQATVIGNVVLLPIAIDPSMVRDSPVINVLPQTLSENKLNLLLAPVSDTNSLPPMILHPDVRGVILHGYEPKGEAADILRQMPVVWMMTRRSSTFWADYVEPDNWQNGVIAATYLLERGHRHFAIINPYPDWSAFRSRCHAFTVTVADAGFSVVTPYGVGGVGDAAHVWERIENQAERLAASSPRPTAIYVPNEECAPVVLSALERRDMRNGADFDMVLGDYDPRIGIRVDEHLAHIDIQPAVIARRTVEQLVWRIQNPRERGPVGVAIGPRLVVTAEQG